MTIKTQQRPTDTTAPQQTPSRRPHRTDGEVQSVKRALTILNTLAEHSGGLTLKQLALTVDLPNSTVHRLLTTLESERYTCFDRKGGFWQIGLQAHAVARSFNPALQQGAPVDPRDRNGAVRR